MFFYYVALMRPKHWIKNLFIVAPLIFSFQFMNFSQVLTTALAVLCFSLAASAVYIMNDIFDKDCDKKHPKKKYRPIASGVISVKKGVACSLLLTVISIGLSFLISYLAAIITTAYLILNLLYSTHLKHIVIIDVFTISAGFVLRVLMGGVVNGVPISEWLILTTIFLSLFLGFGKRYGELLNNDGLKHREVLGHYTKDMLSLFMAMCAVLTIVIYTLYTIDPVISERFYRSRLLAAIPFVVFGVFRYFQMVLSERSGGDVVDVISKDRYIKLTVLIWFGVVIWAIRR